MNEITEIYLELLLEAQFEDNNFKRFDIYKDIEIYYNYEHIKQRLQERYPNLTFGNIRYFTKSFIKYILLNNNLNISNNNILNFICKFTISNVWIAGRFKKNFGKWRIEINTALPQNPVFPKTFKYYEVNK